MAVQSPTDRLLTEANAALSYRTAAQVDTQADARIAAKRGAVNGVAGLGADGLVPPSQLPAAALTRFAAAKTADTVRSNTALSDDPDLVFASVPAGLYAVTALLRVGQSVNTFTYTGQILGPAGCVWDGLLSGSLFAASGTGVSAIYNSATTLALRNSTLPAANTLYPCHFTGTLYLPTAGKVSVQAAVAGGTHTLGALSGLSLTRIG